VKKPVTRIAMGSGQEGWLSVDLDSLGFNLEIENLKRTVETLSLAKLQTRLPNISGLVADVRGGT
jgi:hypothetical protein